MPQDSSFGLYHILPVTEWEHAHCMCVGLWHVSKPIDCGLKRVSTDRETPVAILVLILNAILSLLVKIERK